MFLQVIRYRKREVYTRSSIQVMRMIRVSICEN